MDVEKFRNRSMDEEEVVFGSSPNAPNAVASSPASTGTEGSVKEAVKRWEKEFAAVMGSSTRTKTSKANITLKYDGDDSYSGSIEDVYEDEYDARDDDEDDNKSFEMELTVLARSETLLTEELSRLASPSPVGVAHEGRAGTSTRTGRIPPRRPDPPANGTRFGRPTLSIRVDHHPPTRGGTHQQLPQHSQLLEEPGYEYSSDSSCRQYPLPDPEEQIMYHRSPRRQHSQQLQQQQDPSFQPLSPQSVLSPRRRRRKSVCRYRCCHKSGLVRVVFVVFATTVLLLAVLLPLRKQHDLLKQQTLHVVDFLVSHGISTREDLESFGSAQYRAAQWISKDASDQVGRRRSWSGGRNDPVSLDLIDRYVVAVLYFSLGGGVPGVWPKDWDFLSHEHVCMWNTKKQEHLTSNNNDDILKTSLGVHECQEDEFGNIVPTGIALAFPGLSGALPDELGHLSRLQSLQIDHNHAMGGLLPTCIHKLSMLRKLSLQGCSIAGSLPPWIGDLTQLTDLTLSDNRLQGKVPPELIRLTNLKTLKLDRNLISSPLDFFGPLVLLETLHVHDNLMNGVVEASLLSNWNRLIELDASENQITGSLPANLLSLPSLQKVNLSGNRLEGPIPSVNVEFNANLKVLHLQWNELDGSLPSTITRLISLEDLDVSMNLMTGAIPGSLASLLHLKSISLGNNDFAPASIPTSLFFLDKLERLSLPRSGLTGRIVESIGSLSNLKALDISKNALTGPIPEGLGHLLLLQHLSLRYNRLTGTIPELMNQLTNLDALLLEGNRFTGTAQSLCHSSGDIGEPAAVVANISVFSSDCYDNILASPSGSTINSSDPSTPIFLCPCCTVCCGGSTDMACSIDSNPDDVWAP